MAEPVKFTINIYAVPRDYEINDIITSCTGFFERMIKDGELQLSSRATTIRGSGKLARIQYSSGEAYDAIAVELTGRVLPSGWRDELKTRIERELPDTMKLTKSAPPTIDDYVLDLVWSRGDA